MKQLHLSHGLNLKPSKLDDLSKSLGRSPIIHSLSDHTNKNLNLSGFGQWDRWQDEASQWVKSFNNETDVLAYSISAPLILNALNETNIKINKLILISPAFFPRYSTFTKKFLNTIKFNFYVPSFNTKSDRCASWIQSDLYREVFNQLVVPKSVPAKETLLLMHRYDEILNTKQTLDWAKRQNVQSLELKTPLFPPFHATYKPERLPIDALQAYLNSKS